MNFGEALAALRADKRVSRAGWNGRGMWLALVGSEQWHASLMLDTASTGLLRCSPFIGMKTADDCFVPWLASQTDILAEDWTVAP